MNGAAAGEGGVLAPALAFPKCHRLAYSSCKAHLYVAGTQSLMSDEWVGHLQFRVVLVQIRPSSQM